MLDDIALTLARARMTAGLSQEGLADKLGLSRQAVSKWERGESIPDLSNLLALSELYGVSVDELLRASDAQEDGRKIPQESTPADGFAPEVRAVEADAELATATESTVIEPADADQKPTGEAEAVSEAQPDSDATASDELVVEEVENGEDASEKAASSAGKAKTIAIVVVAALVLVAIAGWGVYKMVSSVSQGPVMFEPAGDQFKDLGASAPDEVTGFSAPMEYIDDLIVTWYGGNVDISVIDDSETDGYLRVAELCAEPIEGDEAFEFNHIGGALEVKNSNSQLKAGTPRHLSICIPKSYADALDIVDVRGMPDRCTVQGLSCRLLVIYADSSTSGVSIHDVTAKEFDLGVGGHAESTLVGSFENIRVDQGSGSIRIVDSICPKSADLWLSDSVLSMILPEESSFAVRLTNVSGTYSCAFPQNDSTDFTVSWPQDHWLESKVDEKDGYRLEPLGETTCYGPTDPTGVIFIRTQNSSVSLLS